MIHRDVKPSNLLIDAKGSLWITDFGLARRLADPGLTHHESLLGTPRYMSPEQARTGSIDGRTDVYSLGATLYELLTLRPPFDGQSAAELLDQIGRDDPVPPRKSQPRLPRDMETIVLKALAKRPVDRYATAAALAEDLTRFLNREPVKARRISPIGRLWRVVRRHPGISVVTTAAAAAVLAIATIAYVRVVAERNEAVNAQREKGEALESTKEANRKYLAALVTQYRARAALLRTSNQPNRRADGLELIKDAVALGPEAGLRAELRDEAVEFLVLRAVEARRPELATGRTQGMAYGPNGYRLAVLSEDGDQLDLWDPENRRRLATLPLHTGTSPTLDLPLVPSGLETSSSELQAGERPEPVQGAGPSPSLEPNPSRGGPGAAPSSPRRIPFGGPRLALTGRCLAVVLPDSKGFRLLDALSGAPLRTVNRSEHERDGRVREVLSLVADAAGRRFVTIERVFDEALVQDMDEMPVWDGSGTPGEYQVILWDLDRLDQPTALQWPPRHDEGPPPAGAPPPVVVIPPLVAISPDGRLVAVAPLRGTFVQLFSGEDGKPVRIPGEDGKSSRGSPPIQTQIEMRALALGPNSLLAAAGSNGTAGGGTVKLFDTDTRALLASLTPTQQHVTSQMRFQPAGDATGAHRVGTHRTLGPTGP